MMRSSLLALSFLLVVPASGVTAPGPDSGYARFVNPFIGTANGGNTFPGAVLPWGMVSVSPHTDLHAPSGYLHGRPWFYGLGHTHLSGTGCTDLGSIIITAMEGDPDPLPERYRCSLIDEKAAPGYWAGTLVGPDLRAEATATLRSGVIRLSPLRQKEFTLMVDAGRNLSLLGGGEIRWISPTELEGYNVGGGFCGEANRHRTYFFARLSAPPRSRGTWRGEEVDTTLAARANATAVGAWGRYSGSPALPLEIRVGVSYVSCANARRNLDAESRRERFDSLRRKAGRAWEKELSRVRVAGGSRDRMTVFYTALYHSLIHPNIISDVNGEYPLFTRAGTARNVTRPRYSVFSLWDTYRTLHPLLTLAYPGRQSEIVRTMIDMYHESGWLPKWELAGNETYMMVGDGGGAVVAETFLKGIRDFDTAAAYSAIRKPLVHLGPEAEPLRPGYADQVRRGYIPADQDTTQTWWVWGPVSTSLEYCYTDDAVARVARRMGHIDESREFARRSLFYRNLFDRETRLLRPRRGDGAWVAPFDPLATEGSGSWSGSGGPGYVEGNAWQYTWFVPHDVPGIVDLLGGADSCAAALLRVFTGGNFTINNEPDIAYPYLFTYLPGHEGITPPLVRQIMTADFRSGPDGLPGNDDAGAISAWFVFSALGIYPASPASGEYRLGLPFFSSAEVDLHPRYYPGKVLRIARIGIETSTQIGAITWNGRTISPPAITHDEVIRGGTLTFSLAP